MANYGFQQLTDSKQPAISYADPGFNGEDVLIGDGVNSQGYLDGIDWHDIIEDKAACTIYWVGSIDASPSLTYQNLWNAKNSADWSRFVVFFQDSIDEVHFRRYNGTNSLKQNTIAVPDRSLFFFAHRNKGAAVSDHGEIFVNNVASAVTITNMNLLTGGMTLNESWLMSDYIEKNTLEGKFGGMWTYNEAHSDANMTKMFAYLAGRFGTPG